MKIGIQTYGSRGDINPWIALGQKLARAGHQVSLYYTSYTDADFSHYTEPHLAVISTRDLDADSGAYAKVQAKAIYDMDILDLTDYMVKEIFDLFENEMILAGRRLCQDSDLIINNPNLYHTACLAEKYKIPRANILVECQFSPSNRVSQYRDEHINNYFLARINNYRHSLGLGPIHNVRDEMFNSGWLNLLAYSRVFSTDEESWGARYKLCGYFDLDIDPALKLSDEMELFLAEGSKPIFISMGSLAFFEGASFTIMPILLEAIELAGCRAIIQADWRKSSYRPENNKNIHLVDYLPHHLILPKCLGMVHHGGAGTSHAALLNECPSIVIAYAWDQFYWGRELDKLGVSAGMIKRKYLDALQLAGAIRRLSLDPDFKQNAVQTRRNMKREKGLERAEKYLLEAFAELPVTTAEEAV
jgi:sterol 3beta-glucosyltransferase